MDLVADENVPGPVIERLTRDGHLIESISAVAAGISDLDVIARSNARAFVLLTHDRDFGELAVKQGMPIVGVVLLETERLSVPAQVERISSCLAAGDVVFAGRFTVIEPARIRQRLL